MAFSQQSTSKKLFLGHFIEDVGLGQSFLRSSWPLHITLVPWFTCQNIKELDANLHELSRSIEPFEIRVGSEEMFGSKKNIKVNIVEPNEQLTRLHKTLLNKISSIGRLESDKQFVGESYRAHITHSRERHIPKGSTLFVNSIHLTELTNESSCTPLKCYKVGS